MPRPRGPHGKDVSQAVCVRLPNKLAVALFQAAGADRGPAFAEHVRNVIRRSVGVPLGFEAGYEEGKMQGWAEANQRLRDAMKGA